MISRFARTLGPVSAFVVMSLTANAHAGALDNADKATIEVSVPTLAFDDTSITIVWNKPAKLDGIVDYEVSINGAPAGRAIENARAHSASRAYLEAFEKSDTTGFHVRPTPHAFVATGLKPVTEYRFQVRAVSADGKLSAPSTEVVGKTTAVPTLCPPTGAAADGKTLDTEAIQKAIDACPAGGKVVLTKGVYRSGALFLKSDLTFEVAEGATLLGSDRSEDYPVAKGYKLYHYSTTQRPSSLINAIDPANGKPGAFKNIRIVGAGTIDGDGFKLADPPSTFDELGKPLPERVGSDNKKVGNDGILAKRQVETAVAGGMPVQVAYGQRRSSLMTLRGVEGLYIGGLTLTNPAFHGAMVEESKNITVQSLILKTYDSNNGDGVELGHSEHAVVFDSFFDTGDDCLNFAAGTGSEAESQPPQSDTWIFNNYFRRGHGAVVMGSHTGAWIENILAEDNVIFLTDVALRAKSTTINGGGGRNVLFRNNAVRDPDKQAFILTLDYSDPNALIDFKPSTTTALFRDIRVENVTVEYTGRPPVAGKVEPAIVVKADPKTDTPHRNVVFDRVRFKNAPSVQIDGLKDSVFRDVIFDSPREPDKLWSLKNTDNIKFEGATVPPKP